MMVSKVKKIIIIKIPNSTKKKENKEKIKMELLKEAVEKEENSK